MRNSWLTLTVLAAVAVLVWCLRSRPAAIQADVRACAESRLAAAGVGRVSIGVEGRDVRLTGSVAEATDRDRAGIAALRCGARAVSNQLTTGTGGGPYTTTVCVQPGRLEIRGSIPDRSDRSELLTLATDRVGDVTVSTNLSIRPDPPAGYREVVRVAFREVSQLEDGCVEVVDGGVSARGRVRSAEVRDRILAELDAAADAAFQVEVDLDVPRLSDDALSCQEAFDALLAPGARVLFDFDGTEIHDEGRALLDEVERIWTRCPGTSILVVGHTDDVGDGVYNRDLSLRRAQAVVDHLVGAGLNPDRLTARGLGEAQPRAPNHTGEGRASNRRIELRVLEAGR